MRLKLFLLIFLAAMSLFAAEPSLEIGSNLRLKRERYISAKGFLTGNNVASIDRREEYYMRYSYGPQLGLNVSYGGFRNNLFMAYDFGIGILLQSYNAGTVGGADNFFSLGWQVLPDGHFRFIAGMSGGFRGGSADFSFGGPFVKLLFANPNTKNNFWFELNQRYLMTDNGYYQIMFGFAYIPLRK